MTGRWGDTTGSSSVRVASVHSLGSQAALLDLEIMWVGGNSFFGGIQSWWTSEETEADFGVVGWLAGLPFLPWVHAVYPSLLPNSSVLPRTSAPSSRLNICCVPQFSNLEHH